MREGSEKERKREREREGGGRDAPQSRVPINILRRNDVWGHTFVVSMEWARVGCAG